MKKTNKKEIRALIEAQSKGQKELIYNEGNSDEFKVKVVSAIPYTKRAGLIREIFELNFVGNGEHIDEYMPSALEFARKYCIIKYYTDLQLPTNLDELWLVLNHTSIYRDVCEFVGEDVQVIFNEADKLIEAKLSYLSSKSDLNLLIKKITGVVEKFGDNLKDIDLGKFASILSTLSGVSPDQLVDSILKYSKQGEEKAQ